MPGEETIVAPFSWCVYSPARPKSHIHVQSPRGIERILVGGPMAFQMWVSVSRSLPGFTEKLILVEFEDSVSWSRAEHPAEKSELARQLGCLFCSFVQGALVGWDVVEHGVSSDGHRRDQILIHNRMGEGTDLESFADSVGLSVAEYRQACRKDVLLFALRRYGSEGQGDRWSAPDLHKSGSLRMPYAAQLTESVASDLAYEGILDRVSSFRCNLFGLMPSHFELRQRELDDVPRDWLEHLRNVGQAKGWLKKPAQPQDRETIVTQRPQEEPGEPKVFVIHGHDEAKWRELVDLLKNRLRLDVVVMQDAPGMSRTFIEKFEQEANKCNAAIAVLTPDDFVKSEDGEYGQPRPNVVFELGWFVGKCGRDRTLMVAKEGTRVPTDWLGIEQLRFTKDVEERYGKLENEINEWRTAKS